MGLQGHCQAGVEFQGHQGLAAQHAAADAAQQLQPLGDALDRLAIQDGDSEGPQAGRDHGGWPHRHQLAQPRRTLGQEGGAQADGQPTQFAVGGRDGHLQGVVLLGVLETGAGAAVVVQQGVGDQLDEMGKGQHLVVATAALLVEQTLQERGVGHLLPEQ